MGILVAALRRIEGLSDAGPLWSPHRKGGHKARPYNANELAYAE
jgi:hypothetical protein